MTAEPAEAHRGRGYGRRSYYRGGSCYRPRRSYHRSYSYGRRYYRPRTRVVRYVDRHDYGYAPSYRYASYGRSYGRRYRCGCGSGFASAYWLDYHRDHADCDY